MKSTLLKRLVAFKIEQFLRCTVGVPYEHRWWNVYYQYRPTRNFYISIILFGAFVFQNHIGSIIVIKRKHGKYLRKNSFDLKTVKKKFCIDGGPFLHFPRPRVEIVTF